MNPARFIFSVLFFIFSFFIFNSSAFAQTTEPKLDLHNYTQNVMIEVISALNCQLAGIDLIDSSQKCLGINNGKIGPVDSTGGAIGTMGNLIAATFTPPFGSGDYVGYLAGNFGITKSAYAQGIGFEGLSPLTNVWVAFRNITYLLLVLIFLIIGFAIMLRVRIDPRTVMSIENQIPKIIVGLILVTFSFAIVGFLIDLMWVLIYLSLAVFDNIFETIPGGTPLSNDFKNSLHGLNPLEAVNNLNLRGEGWWFDGPGKDGILGIASNASEAIRILVAKLFGGLNFPVIGGLIEGLAFIIIAAAILFSLFRLWFTLIKAYVMILIVAVFSPFWVLAGLVPGSRLTFGNLLRELGSNLISFPATLIMLLLAKTFIDIFADPQVASGVFVPPFIGNPGGADGAKAIGALAGLGMILLTPDVVKMMRKALQAPDFDFSAIGKAIGVGTAPIGRGIKAVPEQIFGPEVPQGGGQLGYPAAAGGALPKFLRSFGLIR